jgi:hypothetical protein
VGEEPDLGFCNGVLAYHIEQGTIDGTDVSGHTLAGVLVIPGRSIDGNWKVRLYVDEDASDEQLNALLSAFGGKLGGPLADVASMIGELTGVERAVIRFDLTESLGTLVIGDAVDAEMTPMLGSTGQYTSLRDAVFSTIPGAPAMVGRSTRYRVNAPEFQVDLSGHSAIWGAFRFEA